MFGSPGIALAGEPVTGFVSLKSRALVFYLAATGETHRRSHLAGLLWSDVAEERARKNLRDVLSNLRSVIGPFLEIARHEVAIASDVPLVADTAAFEAAVRAGGPASLARATALYSGEFLAGFYLSGAPLFDEWALGQREHYRLLALHALSDLTSFYIAQGQSLRAIDTLTQLLSADPWREDAHRQLMTLLAAAGDTGAAVAQYQRLRTVLRDELGVEPDDETEALYRQIRTGTHPGVSVQTAPVAPPSLLAVTPASNLPARTHPFVGRGQEVDRVLASIGDPACRLLTVAGPGGMGKTELVLHSLRELLASPQSRQYSDGVIVVSLHSVGGGGQPVQLAAAIGDALGLIASEPVPVDTLVIEHLRPRRVLLVLDSFEHMFGARDLVADLLTAAKGLMVVVTSRRTLGLSGEHLLTLHGLPVPAEDGELAGEWDFPALQLFRQQARTVAPDFDLDSANISAVARICRCVAGLPLGVMLAASLVRYLSVEEIAGELARDIRFIDEGTAGGQRGLRSVFERSWRLLEPEARHSLVRLVQFRGGFTRATAAALADASLSTLAALMDASFLQRVPGSTGAASRYEVIEVLRVFVAEQVNAREEEQLRSRHSGYFLHWLGEIADDLQGRGQRRAIEALSDDLDNVRAAWDWAVTRRDAEGLDRAALGLFRYYEMRSLFREGAERFIGAAQFLDGSELDRIRARLLARGAWFAFQLSRQQEARAWLEQGVTLFRDKEDRLEQLFCLNYLAAVMQHSGDYESAEFHGEAALRLARQCANVHGVVVAQNILSQIAYEVGEFARARRLAQISLALDRERGNNWSTAFSLVNVGRALLALGEFANAVACFSEALKIRKAIGDPRGTGYCLNLLGDVAAAQDNIDEARLRYHDALGLFEGVSNLQGAGESLLRLGRLALVAGDLAVAERTLLEALRRASLVGATPLQLGVLAELAVAFWHQGDPRAAELAELVLSHNATRGASRARLDWFGAAASAAGEPDCYDRLREVVASLLPVADSAVVAVEI